MNYNALKKSNVPNPHLVNAKNINKSAIVPNRNLIAPNRLKTAKKKRNIVSHLKKFANIGTNTLNVLTGLMNAQIKIKLFTVLNGKLNVLDQLSHHVLR